MSTGFDNLVAALETRYDFHSARTLVREALGASGLKEQDAYSKDEMQRFADGLATVGTSLSPVWTVLGVAPKGQEVPKPEPAAAPAKAEAKKDAPKKDDAKPDAKKDAAKKDDAKPAKADAKKDAKPAPKKK